MALTTEKLCSKCGKPGRFRKNKRKKDGLRSECADCQDAYGKSRMFPAKEAQCA